MTKRFFLILLLCFAGQNLTAAEVVVQTLFEHAFTKDLQGWRAERGCRNVIKNGLLHIEAVSGIPFLHKPVNYIGGEFRLTLEIKTGTESEASLYWISRGSPRREETNKITQRLTEDGEWHDYEFLFTISDMLQGMVLRFSANDGSWDIRSVKLTRKSMPPLAVRNAEPFLYKKEREADREMMKFTVGNNVLMPMKYRIGRQPEELTLNRSETVDLAVPIKTEGNLAAVVLTLHPEEFPDIVRPLFLYQPEGKTKWISKPVGDQFIDIAPDARMARLRHKDGSVFGIIAPIVHTNGEIPKFTLAETQGETDTALHFESDKVDLKIDIVPPHIHLTMKSHQRDRIEGPAVRLFGVLRSGLLPGVEFLRSGGTSSSEIDLEKPYNDRSLPNPKWITQPFAVLETDKGGAVLSWNDLKLQPSFSSPNRFDQQEDHRISLIGSEIQASLELLAYDSVEGKENESAVFRVLKTRIIRHGFPDPPPAPRSAEEQRQLSMQALAGALQSETGGQWGYALDPKWERKPFADMISTLFRLTEAGGGRMTNPVTIVPGGADISNDTIFFIAGGIPDWLKQREAAIEQIMTAVNPDGSFLYRTRFPEVEQKTSSFGYTALQTLAVMEYVRMTGSEKHFMIVKKALEYLDKCDVPCGGFYREAPFHTPDLQTAATLIWLYTWAYEHSGNAAYLERAKHFAYSGLPFVYHVNQAENSYYGTAAKFGGTNRNLPLDFGTLSLRTGIQYAYALCLLAKNDKEIDWKKPAKGILHAAEKLQFTDGIEAGCIPEKFDLIEQKITGDKINPCAMVSLRWAVEGKTDSLFVLTDGKERYVSPYAMKKTAKGIVSADVPAGQKFQILRNGNRFGSGEGTGIVNTD
ncbi:MAG: hypothetical protein LBH00_03120 [Planctomycetaceae bacterium]|jgi:hypothetical protein|nr:hypothetical protein [Planctomycetaceae bacterium]